jgi:predicted nucleotidyltransferase component of viral defense system
VDVLIDKRELLSIARKRNLNLNIVEKDYVLGWLLFGFSRFGFQFIK